MINNRGVLVVCLLSALFIMAITRSYGQEQSLREWFNSLRSPAGGVCCHNFDGISLDEAEWRNAGGKYEVLIEGKWVEVPEPNLVTAPNRLGRAHLWLRPDGGIRCFIPGVMM
jgi:hypothetical protein